MLLEGLAAWLNAIAFGLLLLPFQVQGETPSGDNRDQDKICHVVQSRARLQEELVVPPCSRQAVAGGHDR
jgi:hypothetical protein